MESKATVFIINHSVVNCGVYQYGKRVGHILQRVMSAPYKYLYFEMNSHHELDQQIETHKPRAIIYNFLSGTMPWVTEETVAKIRTEHGICQCLIVHNVGYDTFFDYFLHQNPNHAPLDTRNFALLRPLFDIPIREDHKPKKECIRIGSFGFGFGVKHFEDICSLVNAQFVTESVEIHLHLTKSFFCANALEIDSIQQRCRSNITHSNISLHFTDEFWSDEVLLDFLRQNDLNIFFYTKYTSYNGISSCIDYALSAKKPIAICQSNMFSHIYNAPICVEQWGLKEIIQNGFSPLQTYVDEWSNQNFVEVINRVMSQIMKD